MADAVQQHGHTIDTGGDDLDLEFDEDELFDTANYREQRLEELKRQCVYFSSPKQPSLTDSLGTEPNIHEIYEK